MTQFAVEHVVNDDATLLKTFDTKEEALQWAKENYRQYTSGENGGVVSVISADFDESGNRTDKYRWKTYKAFW